MTNRPTLSQIAESCGTDGSTVSRVLNNRLGPGFSVRPDLQARIRQVARELHYRPNFVARSLAKRRTALITILQLAPEEGVVPSIYENIITQIALSLKAGGYEICTGYLMNDGSSDQLPSWQSDGVIVLQGDRASLIEELEGVRLPYVCVNCECGPSGSAILVDEWRGVQLAMNHLLELGHRRITYCGTRRHTEHASVRLRYEGYLNILKQEGIEPSGPHDGQDLSPEQFLQQAIDANVTAVLAYDHVEAIRMLYAARALRVNVPQQISFACFNDMYPCDLIWPSLTTVALPSAKMGRLAATMLMEQMKSGDRNQKTGTQVLSPDRLVVRGSTAPPRAGGTEGRS